MPTLPSLPRTVARYCTLGGWQSRGSGRLIRAGLEAVLFRRRRRYKSLQLLNTVLDDLQLAEDRCPIARARPSPELRRLVRLRVKEQISKRNFERFRDANYRRKAKILPSCFEVPDKCPVHFEIVCQGFLRSKPALHANVAYPLPEAPKCFVHLLSVRDRLLNGLPLDR